MENEMKPSVTMDQKIVLPEVVVPQSEVKKQVLSRKMIGLILGITMVALVAAGAFAGVFVGKSMTKGIYKEAWVTFKMRGSGEEVKERIVVENKEVLIRKPGEIGMIYDYGKKKITMQLDSLFNNVTGACGCMVFDFDPSTEMSLEEIIQYLNKTYMVERDAIMENALRLTSTGRKVDVESLSKKSKEMCLGCNIYEVEIDTSADDKTKMQKRRSCRTYRIRICRRYRGRIYCRFFYIRWCL